MPDGWGLLCPSGGAGVAGTGGAKATGGVAVGGVAVGGVGPVGEASSIGGADGTSELGAVGTETEALGD